MKVRPRLVSVFVKCRYGLEEGVISFETDYTKAGVPFVSVMFDLILSIWNEIVPVGEKESPGDGGKVSILEMRKWRLSIDHIGTDGVFFSIRVTREEYSFFEKFFSKDQYIYLEIVPGGWHLTLSKEEYDSKMGAQKDARLKRIEGDRKKREGERRKSNGIIAEFDKTEVIHIG